MPRLTLLAAVQFLVNDRFPTRPHSVAATATRLSTEPQEPWGREARNYLLGLLPRGTDIQLEIRDRDKTGARGQKCTWGKEPESRDGRGGEGDGIYKLLQRLGLPPR